MSYDLKIYFPHESFPYEEWNRILSLFNAEERKPIAYEHGQNKAEWVVLAESRVGKGREPEIDPVTGETVWIRRSPVWIDLSATVPKLWGDCVPVGTRWSINLDTSGGASAKAIWTQFAIPCFALSFIEGITVHDCQWHREDNMYSFQDAEAWAEFASLAVRKRTWIWARDLVEEGLMTEEGKVLL
jgi:hypothetical protein